MAGAQVRKTQSVLASFPARVGGGPARLSAVTAHTDVYEQRPCLSGRRGSGGGSVGGREVFVPSKILTPFGPCPHL